jgi:hypothetical protein
MTSHSSQGQTAERVLIHVVTALGAKDLLNRRMAYVSVSRGRYDAQIYTNNAATLRQELSRDVSHSPAIQQEPMAQKIEQQPTHTNGIGQGFGLARPGLCQDSATALGGGPRTVLTQTSAASA